MTRRTDPERIHQAQRAGIVRRPVDAERLDELDAEHWITRWEREPEEVGISRGTVGYWDEAGRWIAEQPSERN
jgi:hypothetical protein